MNEKNKNGEMTVNRSEPDSDEGKVTCSPRVDIAENGNEIVLIIDMPGVNEKDVSIMIDKNILKIEANVTPKTIDGYTMVLSEWAYGKYSRSFALSNDIDRDRISAKVKNGILTLLLPKTGPVKAQVIKVKAG
jgi:HSP20 family protein